MMTVDEKRDILLERPLKEIWAQVLEIMNGTIKDPVYLGILKPAQLLELTRDEAVVGVVNDFPRSIIQNRHIPDIENALAQVIGRRVSVRVAIESSLVPEYSASIASISIVPAPQKSPAARQEQRIFDQESLLSHANLNPRYSFDSFVVGSHNRFGHSAARAVAEKPGQSYNPLFLYGGVGLGKTHLMQAIGQQIVRDYPERQVRYVTSEKFTNEVIASIREQKMSDFRRRYRQVDVLLLDDVQFIEKTESTQEEFFHTFNALKESGKQIVISSDRPPSAMSRLEERLRSRFEWGLIADVQPPDYETRLAILQQKAQQDCRNVPLDVLEYIAATFINNVRELEGALASAHALADLNSVPLDSETVAALLKPKHAAVPRPVLTIERIIDAVAAQFRVESSDLRGSKRSKELVTPRHVAMYLASSVLNMSYPRIGQAFGDRKHTSALYACDKVKEALLKDQSLAESVRQIQRQLGI